MFLKPFKIKSNHQLKVTDKKNLKTEFKKYFPNLTNENIEEILPKKELISVVKIETASQVTVQVYTVNKCPMAFMYDNVLFPTIYLLWKYPNILLTFTTHAPVLSKLLDGANLMLPGVVIPPTSFPDFMSGVPACVNLSTNKAAVAVGITAQSYQNMIKSEGRGKCVIVFHIIGDKLCTLEGITNPTVPEQGCPDWMNPTNNTEICTNEINSNPELLETFSDTLNIAAEEDVVNADQEDQPEMTTLEMDELVKHCFYAAIKYRKDITLPLLTSTFYKVFMVPACPSDKVVDIKKSTYKKLSSFLQSMAKLQIIKVEEQKKGVDVITEINHEHPTVLNFILNKTERPINVPKSSDHLPSTIIEAHSVTAKVLPVFTEFGFRKGSVISNSDIRKYVTEYVKNHNLQSEENKLYVNVNVDLKELCVNADSVLWQTLIEKIFGTMSPCYKISCNGNEVIHKGKLEPINITVVKRSSNKKVTLVDNIETYGISIEELSTYCQRSVAASTSINRSQNKKQTDQLLIQGNQVLFIYNLLTDKYKVPKKYIKGLEFAPKQKN